METVHSFNCNLNSNENANEYKSNRNPLHLTPVSNKEIPVNGEKKSPLKFLVRVTSFKTKAHFDTETLDTSRRGQAGLLEIFFFFFLDGTDSLKWVSHKKAQKHNCGL